MFGEKSPQFAGGPNNGGAEMATPGPGAYMVSSTVGCPGILVAQTCW